MSRFLNFQTLILTGCILLVFYLAILPLFMLLYGSVRSAPPGDTGAFFTFKNYFEAYFDLDFYRLTLNSILFSLGSCFLTLLIGSYLAWVSERTNTPFKKMFVILALIPFIIPGILNTISWILLLNPRTGMVNVLLQELLNIRTGPFNIYSLSGMIWVESIHHYPLAFLLMSAAFRNMDTSMEEASLVAGAGNLKTFRHVTLPLVRPALFSVALLIFIQAIEAFEVPALLGIPAKISVFTSKIFLAVHQFPPNYGLASSYAVTLLVISMTGVFLYTRIARRGENYATVTGKNYRPRVIDLGRWKYVTATSAILIFFIAAVVPALVMLWTSFAPYYGIAFDQYFEKMTLDNYISVLKYPLVGIAFRNSFYLSLGAATLVMLLSSVIAWITIKSRIRGRQYLDYLAFSPIAIPGIVLGISLLWVYLTLPIPVYGTIWILLLAYLTKFMPYGMRASSSSMIQIHKELEEAAYASGGTWFQTFRKIILPLLVPGFVAGWIYVSIVSLRELSTSILLYSHDSMVLSVLTFDFFDAGRHTYAAALGVLMMLLLLTMAFAARLLGARIGIVNK
ncbi:MAG: iron ABC transporter permease [Rhodospirillales bacterium]